MREQDVVDRRVNVHLSHIYPKVTQIEGVDTPSRQESFQVECKWNTTTSGHIPTFSIAEMADVLRGSDFTQEDRKMAVTILTHPVMLENNHLDNIPKEEARQRVNRQIKHVLSHPLMQISRMKEESTKFLTRMCYSNLLNISLGTKLGVQVGLFSGSILHLGTERHQHLIPDVESMKIAGCFLMTELTHGSNLKALQTTATYDPKSEMFIMNTPNDGAIKWWIGNAARTAVMGTVFARLITKGKDYGVHAFVVNIRDPVTHEPLPGVYIGDCGDKLGLQAVDNGCVKFDQVPIPRVNLLNRFGDVESDGTYVSSIQSEGRRFAALLGELINGRISISVATLVVRKLAVTIAVRYGFYYPAIVGDQKVSLLLTSDFNRRLMPVLAGMCVCEVAQKGMMERFKQLNEHDPTHGPVPEDDLAYIHGLTAAMKAIFSWDTQEALHTCRELCGYDGCLRVNRLGTLIDDHCVMQTYEGDNTVLVQQLGAYLLKQFSKQFSGNILADGYTFLRQKLNFLFNSTNPIVTRTTDHAHLRSSKFQLRAFEFRTANILQRVAQQFNAQRKKVDPFKAWSQMVPSLIALSRAFIEQYSLENFSKLLKTMFNKQSPVYSALKLARDVFVLNAIEKNVEEFTDILQQSKIDAIRKLNVQLCGKMAQHAVSIVDSFELPDVLIQAPVGTGKENAIQSRFLQQDPTSLAESSS